MSLRIKYWGVRGSLPSSPAPEQWVRDFEGLLKGFFNSGFTRVDQVRDYLEQLSLPRVGGFGTATTCAQVKTDLSELIIDGGSGIRMLGNLMTSQGTRDIHILMTHFHWDHLMGLPFFTPLFTAGVNVHFYAVQNDLEQAVRTVFRKPYFPVPFEALPSKIHFHTLAERMPFKIGDMNVTPYLLDHPDPCWGYKVESQGRAYAHCVDTEATRWTAQDLAADLPLYQNINMMYFDAQYTFPELSEKANWGHSASQVGLEIAFREKIPYVIFAHHDPGASSEVIYSLKSQTREYHDFKIKEAAAKGLQLPNVQWRFAYEGLEIDLERM